MTIYKMVELKEGVEVQYLGVYVLKWRPEFGQAEVGFVSDEDTADTIKALREDGERLADMLGCSVTYSEDYQRDYTDEEIMRAVSVHIALIKNLNEENK